MAGNAGAEKFARWLNLTMENRNIKSTQLAKKVKVTDSAVSRWRAGTTLPGLPACMLIAKFFDVDPLRLAATAGLLDGEVTGLEPLPMPEPTARRDRVKEQLNSIKGLTARERHKLMEAYDDEAGGS